ncbi:hypothetical protein C2845_PM10G13010 [Panicum miliaceum]|uniref:Uncharacterized protein n=1 Tax=Panicum miliaceum TaxID=4540 RepID=A0A3L6PEE4_PANMI|nr:hypothetical protein C2845_PM10G13010 [Panicum miliaceum]
MAVRDYISPLERGVTKIRILDASGPPGLPSLLTGSSNTTATILISALSFSPDGEGLVAFSENGLMIRWWSLGTGWWERLSRSLTPIQCTKLIYVPPWEGFSPNSARLSIISSILGHDKHGSSECWCLLLAVVLVSTPLLWRGFSFDLLIDFLLVFILRGCLSNGVRCGFSSGSSTPSETRGWDRFLRCTSASTASRTAASVCNGGSFLLSSLLKACDQTVGPSDRHYHVQSQVAVN